MAEPKTKPSLLDALRRAASRPLTEDELRRQRVSFIMGSVKSTSAVSREQVERVLAKHEGRKAAQ